MDETLAFVMAGGQGEGLPPPTDVRAKPAVPFGGIFRIIDFTLSNCVNSGLRRIYVLTQYKSYSLSSHLRTGWNMLSPRLNQFIDEVPAQQQLGSSWYQGTADAIRQNFSFVESKRPRLVLVLSGDHVYKMDYGRMLRAHIDSGATATLAALEVPIEDATRFGVIQVDEADRIVGFQEKPRRPTPVPGTTDIALASMGIYVFETGALTRALKDDAARPSNHDFGKDILPGLLATGAPMYVHRFHDENKKSAKYWRDIGTIDAYFEANLDLCAVNPECTLYDPECPLRTHQPRAPPAKFDFADEGQRSGQALDSIISSGCIISGSRITGSVLCPNVRVHSFCHIDQSILMPDVHVGRHARLRRTIVDRNVTIPRGACIGFFPEEDRKRHTVSDKGVVVVTTGDEPYVAEIPPEALALETAADQRG